MPNQHRPLPPDEDIKEALTFYYHFGLTDVKVAHFLQDHYDTTCYGCSVFSVRRLRKKWGLQSTRQQKHTSDTILEAVAFLRKLFPSRGIENLRKELRLRFNIRVTHKVLRNHLFITEPDQLQARRRRRFVHRRFYAAGVNDVWCQDQHDKWGPEFGLWLHNNIDPFSGFNNWLKVWWTNKNPRLVAAIPLTTQSDPGNENNGVANMQTELRQALDPSLAGTLQHRWKRGKTNVKSEANWSVFRRDFAPGFEDTFRTGVNEGWYDVHNRLENFVFRWLAIPWIQSELDRWVILWNCTLPRADTKKVLPHGVPELIWFRPKDFGSVDFKIPIPPELLVQFELKYAPPDHEVFQLVPPDFEECICAHYEGIARPTITKDTFWGVYLQLLQRFRDTSGGYEDSIDRYFETLPGEMCEDGIDVIDGHAVRGGAVAGYNIDGELDEAEKDDIYVELTDDELEGEDNVDDDDIDSDDDIQVSGDSEDEVHVELTMSHSVSYNSD